MRSIIELNNILKTIIYDKESCYLDDVLINYDGVVDLINEEAKDVDIKKVSFFPLDRLSSNKEVKNCVEVVKEIVNTGNFTSGPYIAKFETALKDFYRAQACIGTSSGTDAIKIALKAAGIKPGDEVIVPLNSFAATENAIFAIGAIPIFANIDDSFNMNPKEVERLVSQKTKAVLPVCFYGSTQNIREIWKEAKKYNLHVIIDSAQCFGIPEVINFGDLVAFSFNPFKNIGGFGKGGAIVTLSDKFAVKARQYSYHGFGEGKKNFKSQDWGYNSRIDNLQAAIILEKMKTFNINAIKRGFLGMRYLDKLSALKIPSLILPIERTENTWHLFPIRVKAEARDDLMEFSKSKQIEFDMYYPLLSHQFSTSYAMNYRNKEQFAASEAIHSSLIHIPIHNHMSLEEQEQIVEVIYDFFK